MFVYFYLFIFLMFIYFFRGRERAHEQWRGREREGDTESEAGSRLHAVTTQPNVGLEPTNCEIMTSAEVGRSTSRATQAPLCMANLKGQDLLVTFSGNREQVWPVLKQCRALGVNCLGSLDVPSWHRVYHSISVAERSQPHPALVQNSVAVSKCK